MYTIRKFAGLCFGMCILMSCNQGEEQQAPLKMPEVKKIMDPFRYHKAIEVKPGLTLDVVSWGRGSDSVGGYLILRSDSTHLEYRSVSGELDGRITDVWDMDLDSDGNPELYIQAKGKGEGSYMNLYVYEFNSSGSSQKIPFPELSSSLKKGYKGNDSVYVKEGKLMREFPLVSSEDTTAKSTAEIRKLEYSLRNNSLHVREL